MTARYNLGPTLMDACPEYRRAILAFRQATDKGNLPAAEKAWAEALKAAHEFRTLKVGA